MTQTILFYDALGYEELGRKLADHGWQEYFDSGPNREPLYPWFVSMAMRAAGFLGTNYTCILLPLQVLVLLLSLYLIYVLLQRLNIPRLGQAIVLIYAATSPVLVYFTFIVWSEVLTFVLVPLLVIVSLAAWEFCHGPSADRVRAAAHGALVGLVMLGLTFVKVVTEMVAVFWVLPWAGAALYFWSRRDQRRAGVSLLTAAGFICIYWTAVFAYQWTNYSHNGQFTLTNRAAWALYGHTQRKMADLTLQQWKAAIAFAPHKDDCMRLLKDEAACAYWDFYLSNDIGLQEEARLRKSGLSPQAVNTALVGESFKKMAGKPVQAAALMGIESLKFLFWEYSARIEYAVYPRWVQSWYNLPFLYPLWRYGTAFVTLGALIWGVIFLWRQRRVLLIAPHPLFKEASALFFMMYFISLFVFFYSFFCCSGRNALPLAPLYIALIAYAFKNLSTRRS